MRINQREIATIRAALSCWHEELFEGQDWIEDCEFFQDAPPLSSDEVSELENRLELCSGASAAGAFACGTDDELWKLKLTVPTYLGAQPEGPSGEPPDFGPPDVPILVCPAEGLRVVLGTHDVNDENRPDVQIERRPRGWVIFIHQNAGDPVACVLILDNGRTCLLPESHAPSPIETVDDYPSELDQL
jgi:hypothetical protein